MNKKKLYKVMFVTLRLVCKLYFYDIIKDTNEELEEKKGGNEVVLL